MKYSLNIGERFNIVNLLPQKGDMLTMQDVQDLQRALIPRPDEREELGIVQNGSSISWAEESAAIEKEIDFTAPQVTIVVNKLREMDKNKELALEQLSLWAKFIGGSNASK